MLQFPAQIYGLLSLTEARQSGWFDELLVLVLVLVLVPVPVGCGVAAAKQGGTPIAARARRQRRQLPFLRPGSVPA